MPDELIVAEDHATPVPALSDFRQHFMTAPVAVMQAALAEYKERRQAFREWLRSQLIEGTHYGFAPGCEPKFCDRDGTIVPREHATHTKAWQKDKEGSGGKYVIVSLAQWNPRQLLYKAGADFICDLLWARDEYDADLAGWEQLGKPAKTFVYRCRLYSKSTSELLGEGRGCRRVGQKGGDENNAIKMAKKSSKVDATINTWGLSDLFEQHDDVQPPHENPEQKPDAPKSQPRSDRVTKEDFTPLWQRWKKASAPEHVTATNWSKFVCEAAGRIFTVTNPNEWTPTDLERLDTYLRERMDA